VRDLCRLYGLPEARTAQLQALATTAREPGWWEVYAVEDDDYVGLETVASQIHEFENSAMPGLLQTRSYTESYLGLLVNRHPIRPWNESEIQEWINLLETRQRIVRPDSGAELTFVLDEGMLLRAGGGSDMRSQIQHILDVAEYPNVHVRVLPLHRAA
jgi:Domain of unknown function (DUF5753)